MIKYSYEILEENIPVEYVEDEHDTEKDFEPSFWYWNKRYYLSDFTRVHNNPWCCYSYPDFIQGVQDDGSRDSFENPLLIRLDDAGETVTVYREVIKNDN